MLFRTLSALSVVVALTVSGSAAHAGFVRNVAKVGVADAKTDVFLLKAGAKGAAKLAKLTVKKDVAVARCLVKAASAQPCF